MMCSNTLWHRITKKMQSNSGETIVETLVSVLISSLALLMLATAIATAVNVVMKSRDVMKTYYQNESQTVKKSSPVNPNPTTVGVTFKSDVPLRSGGVKVDVYSDSANTVTYYMRSQS